MTDASINLPRFAAQSVFRNRGRVIATALGLALAVIAFLFQQSVVQAFYRGLNGSSAEKLVVRNRTSLLFNLPISYAERIRAVPGVTDVTWGSWFGGVYKDPKFFFTRLAVDAESFLRVRSHVILPADQRQAWLDDRAGCIIGRELADKYDLHIGSHVPLTGSLYPGDWDFTVRGIYEATPGSTDINLKSMYMHWKYVDDRTTGPRKSEVVNYLLQIRDPAQGKQISEAIDRMFAGSGAETVTSSEEAYRRSLLGMTSSIITGIDVASIVVLVILMLILGNTLAMATRERTGEYAVLRALGFRTRHIVSLVAAEGITIGITGVTLGVALATPVLNVFFSDSVQRDLGNLLGGYQLDVQGAMRAVAFMVLAAAVSSAIPAWFAARTPIVSALRGVD